MAVTDGQKQTEHIKPVEKFDFFHDERVRSVFYQLLTAAIVGWAIWYLISTTAHNLEVRGMSSGFGFLNVEAKIVEIEFAGRPCLLEMIVDRDEITKEMSMCIVNLFKIIDIND